MQINGTWNTHSLGVLLLFAACESYLPSHTLHLHKLLTASRTRFLLSGFTVFFLHGRKIRWVSQHKTIFKGVSIVVAVPLFLIPYAIIEYTKEMLYYLFTLYCHLQGQR